MPRERSLTRLELIPATVSGKPGWISARWERTDGSTGSAFVKFRRRRDRRWFIDDILISTPTSALLREVPLHRIETAINTDGEARAWIEQAEGLKRTEQRTKMRERYRLEQPTGRRLDDDHYRAVARAYKQAVVYGLQPAKTLSEDSGIPLGTVNRWIAEARERDYLPKTKPGRINAGTTREEGA